MENKKNTFKESISISKDTNILDLQKKYREGLIKEEDLTEEQYQCLLTLYNKQIDELKTTLNMKKQELRNYKNSISDIRKKL